MKKEEKEQPIEPPNFDFLVIGLEGCGKSYLIKQLVEFSKAKRKRKKKPVDLSKNFHYTIPTAGQVQDTFKLTPMGSTVRFKEVGGSMAGTWERHILDCKVIVFVVDLSKKYQFAGAVVEFLSVYSKVKRKKKFLLLFNKSDSSVKFEKKRFEDAIRLGELNSGNPQHSTEVLEVSGFDGENIQKLVMVMENSLKSENKSENQVK